VPSTRRHADTVTDPVYGMMYGMRRTTVYLPDDLKAALERTASARGTSEAEVVREALVAATRLPAYPKPRLPLFESGDSTLAERVDEALAGFGE
jgi:Ribbon-helix-helix protein, copG family